MIIYSWRLFGHTHCIIAHYSSLHTVLHITHTYTHTLTHIHTHTCTHTHTHSHMHTHTYTHTHTHTHTLYYSTYIVHYTLFYSQAHNLLKLPGQSTHWTEFVLFTKRGYCTQLYSTGKLVSYAHRICFFAIKQTRILCTIFVKRGYCTQPQCSMYACAMLIVRKRHTVCIVYIIWLSKSQIKENRLYNNYWQTNIEWVWCKLATVRVNCVCAWYE